MFTLIGFTHSIEKVEKEEVELYLRDEKYSLEFQEADSLSVLNGGWYALES